MSATPIPTKHRDAFVEHMKKVEDQLDHWKLLEAADEFLTLKRMRHGNPDSAVKQYRKLIAEQARQA